MTEAAPRTELYAAWRGAESHCIKCGFCLPVCPTYRETGNEAASPRGRLQLMYAVAQGELEVGDIREHLSFCLGCLACETACPSGIRFRDLLEAGRADAAAAAGWAGAPRRIILSRLVTSPTLLRPVAWLLWGYQRSGLRALLRFSRLLRLVPPLARLEWALPPLPAPRPWRKVLRAAAAGPGSRPGALLFTGCVMDAVFGAVHEATVKVLRHNGLTTGAPAGQVCCGALHLHEGEKKAAQALARRNIAAFERDGDAPILVNSAGCGSFLKGYGHLLAGDAEWKNRAEAVAARVLDVSEFLAALPLKAPTRPMPIRVAYDDPCHLLHAQKVADPPRQLLASIPGLELVALEEASWCCGSAGSYSIHQPRMSARLLARKMGHIAASKAQVVATGNPGCLLQIRLGVERQGLALEVLHPVELLARAYE